MGLRSKIVLAVMLGTVSAAAFAVEPAEVTGTWRNPAGGTCQTAYFKGTEGTKTVRGEAAVKGTIVNSGTTFEGQLILLGARQGQVVSPMNDQAALLFEPLPDNKLKFIPLGGPAAGWPEVVLEKCP